jgi:hypothetical protein
MINISNTITSTGDGFGSITPFMQSLISRRMFLLTTMMIIIAESTCSTTSIASSDHVYYATTTSNTANTNITTNTTDNNAVLTEEEINTQQTLNHAEERPTKYDANDISVFRRITTATCITSERGLRKAILDAPSFYTTPTYINLCTKLLKIDTSKPNNYTRSRGIHLIHKYIHFNCSLPNVTEKCTLDAQRTSRHFYIENSIVSFKNIIFMNGKGTKDITTYPEGSIYLLGGSLWVNSSALEINECYFRNNEASEDQSGLGGALASISSTIQIMKTELNHNRAYSGGAIIFASSQVAMSNVSLTNNSARVRNMIADAFLSSLYSYFIFIYSITLTILLNFFKNQT